MINTNGLRAAHDFFAAHSQWLAGNWSMSPEGRDYKVAFDRHVAALAARCTGLTDMGFILDAATKGELAAYEYAVQNMCVAGRKILNGKDTGHGICSEPWQSLRVQLLELVKAAQQQAAPERAEVRPPVLTESYPLADALYRAGYEDRSRGRDYDPRGRLEWQSVVDAITPPSAADSAQGQQQGGA